MTSCTKTRAAAQKRPNLTKSRNIAAQIFFWIPDAIGVGTDVPKMWQNVI